MIKMNNYRRSSSAASARARLIPPRARRTPTLVADINNRTLRLRAERARACTCVLRRCTCATLPVHVAPPRKYL